MKIIRKDYEKSSLIALGVLLQNIVSGKTTTLVCYKLFSLVVFCSFKLSLPWTPI